MVLLRNKPGSRFPCVPCDISGVTSRLRLAFLTGSTIKSVGKPLDFYLDSDILESELRNKEQ
jgi:hypothetical protein